MGLLARLHKKETDSVPLPTIGKNGVLGTRASEWIDPEIQLQLCGMAIFITMIVLIRFCTSSRFRALRGKHILDLSALNDANICKDVFLAYLNAALLEPVMAIAGMDETTRQETIINVVTLGSICSWIWLITDAFDYTDVCQSFKYQ